MWKYEILIFHFSFLVDSYKSISFLKWCVTQSVPSHSSIWNRLFNFNLKSKLVFFYLFNFSPIWIISNNNNSKIIIIFIIVINRFNIHIWILKYQLIVFCHLFNATITPIMKYFFSLIDSSISIESFIMKKKKMIIVPIPTETSVSPQIDPVSIGSCKLYRSNNHITCKYVKS